jgi:hypothetical protein
MCTTNTNLAPSLWAQPVWTPAQAEEAKLEVDEQARLAPWPRVAPRSRCKRCTHQGPPPPSPGTGSITLARLLASRPDTANAWPAVARSGRVDPIHHQPPQPGHLGGQGQVVSRRYCRKSSRLMSARRGMSTITFTMWASFFALCRSERAAAVGRLTELRHRRLSGGRGMQNWQGTWPCMRSLPSRPAYCLSHRRNCRLVRS